MTLSTDDDKWECTLGKAGFKPHLVYKQHFNHIDKHAPSSWIWKSKCQSKHKFFAWLLLHDRLNTKDMLQRQNWNVTDNHSCVLCAANQLKDWRHLFFNCVFNARIWNYLMIPWKPRSAPETLLAARFFLMGLYSLKW